MGLKIAQDTLYSGSGPAPAQDFHTNLSSAFVATAFFSRNAYSQAHRTPYPESCFTDFPTECLTKSLGGHAGFLSQRQEREAGQKIARTI